MYEPQLQVHEAHTDWRCNPRDQPWGFELSLRAGGVPEVGQAEFLAGRARCLDQGQALLVAHDAVDRELLEGPGELPAGVAPFGQFITLRFEAIPRLLCGDRAIDTSHRAVNAQWSRLISRVTMIVGADYRHTESHQDELRYALVAGVNTLVPGSPFPSGGTEQIAAAYARANISASDAVTIEVGARADSWNSEPEDPALPTQDVSYLSPRAAVMWRQGRFQMQASGYYANRTPSLNELHRPAAYHHELMIERKTFRPEKIIDFGHV